MARRSRRAAATSWQPTAAFISRCLTSLGHLARSDGPPSAVGSPQSSHSHELSTGRDTTNRISGGFWPVFHRLVGTSPASPRLSRFELGVRIQADHKIWSVYAPTAADFIRHAADVR